MTDDCRGIEHGHTVTFFCKLDKSRTCHLGKFSGFLSDSFNVLESGVNDLNCDRHPPRSRDNYKITGFGCISTCLKNVSFEFLTSKLELTQNSYLFGGKILDLNLGKSEGAGGWEPPSS